MKEGKLHGMKSHDCHVFMECLLPIAFISLPEQTWKPLTELSHFFRDLCSTSVQVDDLISHEQNIPIVLCKVEHIFPLGYFDSMEHLPIHLPYEARVGSPVQYRWMYPFERFLHHLKKKVKNKARVEGSIIKSYLIEDISQFCTYYFQSNKQPYNASIGRKANEDDFSQTVFSIFNLPGRFGSECKVRFFEDKELNAVVNHILINCDEIQPYIETFVEALRKVHRNMSDEHADKCIEENFASWLKEYMSGRGTNKCGRISSSRGRHSSSRGIIDLKISPVGKSFDPNKSKEDLLAIDPHVPENDWIAFVNYYKIPQIKKLNEQNMLKVSHVGVSMSIARRDRHMVILLILLKKNGN
ncbi:uncharacterized protein [Cicer arietinum]|uniref:Uncharacterized protein LOC101510894 isoform X2 n=1 Tax=Cicer arietinum TaxID=3827 RepID=A0A3Q7Y6Q8_CICAR|nr:uncharacterized protein LOC101510894 isoform X2 [Cicer arietinum]